MSAARKPDRLLQEATAQARALREQRQATFDAKVARAHEAGTTDVEMARDLGVSKDAIQASRKRQGLTFSREALFGGMKKAGAS